MRRYRALGSYRAQRRERALGSSKGRSWRWIEPGHLRHLRCTPLRQGQKQRREIAGQDLGRLECWAPGMRGFFPQAIGHARALSGRTTRPLSRCRLRRPMSHQPGHACRLVELRPARQAGIDHNRDPVECQRGFGNGGSKHDPPPTLRIAADCDALGRRFALTMQRQDRHIRQPLDQPLPRPLNFANPRQERQHVTRFIAPGGQDRAGHGFIQPLFGTRAQPADGQRESLALTLDDSSIAQQAAKPRTIQRGRHHQ